MKFKNSEFWKAIILYGLNASTYKMGFGLGLIEAARQNKNELNWHELSNIFLTNCLVLPSNIGTSILSISMIALSISKPYKADNKCSIV